jgi:hypothetical protein
VPDQGRLRVKVLVSVIASEAKNLTNRQQSIAGEWQGAGVQLTGPEVDWQGNDQITAGHILIASFLKVKSNKINIKYNIRIFFMFQVT